MGKLCELMGIDRITTFPYRPQGNGIIERFHGTLKPMLAKAVSNGMDWSLFLPLALFAIRQVPNRDLGYSPHELAFGRNVRGPLDLLYAGWVEEVYVNMDVSGWVLSLKERLKCLHESAMVCSSKETKKRLEKANKFASERELQVGTEVMLRVPGLHGALEASWEGPYIVKERLSRVNYKVCREGSDHLKLVHIANTKVITKRDAIAIGAVAVVAEEDEEMGSIWNKKARLSEKSEMGLMWIRS